MLQALSPAASEARSSTAQPAALQVSFDTSAFVRLRGDGFVTLSRRAPEAINELIDTSPVLDVAPVVGTGETALDTTRRALKRAGRRSVPDLNRHYTITLAGRAARDEMLQALGELPLVAEVGRAPEPLPPPATPDFSDRQRYVGAAPGGIGATPVAARPGGLGDRVRIIDIEYAWNQAHEDLGEVAAPGALIPNGIYDDPFGDTNHGTATLGILVGTPNPFGVTGIAPAADVAMVNAADTNGYAGAAAIDVARRNMAPGDVMLLEQQALGIAGTGSQADEYVPMEFDPAAYDAIRLATLSGIVVVEAAGNGGVDLDDPAYGAPFPASKPDSGAIIVGAGAGDLACSDPAEPHSTRSFSTYGSRVDVQGWGGCVVTTAYGNLFNGGPNALYTSSFSGTSSASAVVAGAAAVFSSVFEAESGRAPDPRYVRSRLIATGTPQGAGGHIGPLPNLAAALTGYDGTAPAVSVTERPASLTSDTTPTFAFTANESPATFECRATGELEFAACASPLTLPERPDGANSLEIRAVDAAYNKGPIVVETFTVDSIAPVLSMQSGPPAQTNDRTPTFAFSADEAGATFSCRVSSSGSPGVLEPCGSPYTSPELPVDGAYSLRITARDPAGNASTLSTAFTLDQVAPTVSISGGPASTTDDATPTFTFATDDPVATLSCRAGTPGAPGAAVACASPHTTAALPDGAYVFEVASTDPAGNVGVDSRTFTVDVPAAVAPTFGPSNKVSARLSRDGTVRLARPRVLCPAAPPSCTLSATARRSAPGRPVIGVATTTIAPGAHATARIALARSARRRLVRKGGFAGMVSVSAVHDGAASSRVVPVFFRPPR